jgi:hypothetical protein
LELLGSLPDNERPASIFVGDFNYDGELDALVWVYDDQVGSLHHNVYEFLGNGDGTFAAAKVILPDFGFFAVADLNHDGLPDIVEYNEPLTTKITCNLQEYRFIWASRTARSNSTKPISPTLASRWLPICSPTGRQIRVCRHWSQTSTAMETWTSGCIN